MGEEGRGSTFPDIKIPGQFPGQRGSTKFKVGRRGQQGGWVEREHCHNHREHVRIQTSHHPTPALPRFRSHVSEHLCCRGHAERQSPGSSRERHPPGRQSEGSGHRYGWGEPLASGRNETQTWETRPASGSRVINKRLSQGLGARQK